MKLEFEKDTTKNDQFSFAGKEREVTRDFLNHCYKIQGLDKNVLEYWLSQSEEHLELYILTEEGLEVFSDNFDSSEKIMTKSEFTCSRSSNLFKFLKGLQVSSEKTILTEKGIFRKNVTDNNWAYSVFTRFGHTQVLADIREFYKFKVAGETYYFFLKKDRFALFKEKSFGLDSIISVKRFSEKVMATIVAGNMEIEFEGCSVKQIKEYKGKYPEQNYLVYYKKDKNNFVKRTTNKLKMYGGFLLKYDEPGVENHLDFIS